MLLLLIRAFAKKKGLVQMASSSAMRLLLISLLCKVRRADETTLKVFAGHLGECGTNYLQMGCTQDRLLLRGKKSSETVLVILTRFMA